MLIMQMESPILGGSIFENGNGGDIQDGGSFMSIEFEPSDNYWGDSFTDR